MKTQYFLLKSDKAVKISGQIAHMLTGTHNFKALNNVNKTNFLFVFRGDEGNFFPIMNKVLKSKRICICEKCGSHHAENFAYCPWCGKNRFDDEKKVEEKKEVIRLTAEEVETARFVGKLSAIKLYRERTQKGLYDAKHEIEDYMYRAGYKFFGET